MGEPEPTPEGQAEPKAPETDPSNSETPSDNATDNIPPRLTSSFEHLVTGWGRVQLSWLPAEDDLSPSEAIESELWSGP